MEYVDIAYDEVGWKNYPSTSTKINAENLNKMEKGIKNLVAGVTELRTLLGSDNLQKDNIIEAVNELSGKFGGYKGYNLLNMGLLMEETNGFSISGTLAELGMVPNASYTLSMSAEEDIYFYQYDANDEMLATEILSDGSAVSFTLGSSCNSIKIFFPKSLGYVSEELCGSAKVMLEAGTEKHDYEPYTGGEEMSDLWQEILENQNAINRCETFLQSLSDILEGSY